MEKLISHTKICLRSGSFKLLAYLGVSSLILAMMISIFAGRQQITLLVDFAFSSIRLSMCFAALLWVQEVFAKTLDTKTIVQYLAFPASRSSYVYNVFLSISVLLFAAVIVFALFVFGLAKMLPLFQIGTPVDFGFAYMSMWLLMLLDILVVMAFCILITTVSTTPNLALVVSFGFYLAGHSIQGMIDLLNIAVYIDGREFFQVVLSFIRYVIPDLSSFDVRHWSIYSEALIVDDLLYKVVAAISYMLLSILLAAFCFSRREII